ncbi:hypothetical protein V2W45_135706 [Cenococcum geophilum]
MVQYSRAIIAAMLLVLGVIHRTQALDCQQVQFGFTFNTWASTTAGYCQQACATASNSNYLWQVAHPDSCEGADGLSGITPNEQEGVDGSCYCTYVFVIWRAHKTDQQGQSCAPSDIANRIQNNASPWFQITLNDNVHCGS